MAEEKQLPNVLIIMTDQQSSWTLSAYGGTEISTPHIDRLAEEGVRLDNYFVNVACCTPSRGCFFTGLYPHRHGAPFNDMPLRDDATTLAHHMNRAGYDTIYIGKWHLAGDGQSLARALEISNLEPSVLGLETIDETAQDRNRWLGPDESAGFQDSHAMFNCSHAKKIVEREDGSTQIVPDEMGDEETYTTDWLTTQAIEAIRRPRQQPFFLTLSIPDPHDPFSVRAPFDELFAPETLSVPDSLHQENVPQWLLSPQVQRWHSIPGGRSAENLRRIKAQYLGEVACIDQNVGRLLQALEETELLDKTIVIFTTDHGEYMGEHGIYAKNQLYETAYHVPFILRHPDRSEAGSTVNAFVSSVDVAQTVLELLGLPADERQQGRSAAPWLRGEEVPWQDEVFIYGTAYNRAGIITPAYELAYVKGSEDHILFDRQRDPQQVNNLFHDPAHQEVVDALTARLLEHNREIDSPEVTWLEGLVSD